MHLNQPVNQNGSHPGVNLGLARHVGGRGVELLLGEKKKKWKLIGVGLRNRFFSE